ncbi:MULTISPECIES: ATP-binding protein [Actinosynnema]|uniref:ATP-binding protein n=1 Tax=Actinosynnema TaxID=40566 RepID=UPI0020A2E31F|nr:ATP-binding protein [Actinosynnema pretiosum]MCP2099975.1 hypothetical protein [Actinosynnema pretiosum]
MRIVERPGERIDVVLHDDDPPLARMRKWTSATLAELGVADAVDTQLVGNALLSNAFRHAIAPRCFRLRLVRDVVRVEVEDGSPQLLPVLSRFEPLQPTGRGLLLVNRLATLWGVVQGATAKTVWAEIAVNRPGA